MKKFQLGMVEYIEAAKISREAAYPIAAKVEPIMMEFLMCTTEAMLFTDRETFLRLTEGAKHFITLLNETAIARQNGESWSKVLDRTASVNKIVESLDFELTHRLRREFGLDKLKPKDLQT